MEAALFAVNVALFGLWVWATVDCAIAQRNYVWLVAVAGAPILVYFTAAAYFINFKLLPAIGQLPIDEVIARRRRERALRGVVADRGLVSDHFALADHYFDAQQWQPCLAALKPVLDAEEDNLRAHYRAGVSLLRLGRAAAAAEHLDFVVHEDPFHAGCDAAIRLAEARTALGDEPAAEEALRLVLKREYHPEATMELARRLEARGENAEALTLAERLVADSQRNSAVWHTRYKKWIKEARQMVVRRK